MVTTIELVGGRYDGTRMTAGGARLVVIHAEPGRAELHVYDLVQGRYVFVRVEPVCAPAVRAR